MLKALQNTDKGNSCQGEIVTKMNIRFIATKRLEDSGFAVWFLTSFPWKVRLLCCAVGEVCSSPLSDFWTCWPALAK